MTRHGTIGALCACLLLAILPGCGAEDAGDAGGPVPPAPVVAGTEPPAGAPLPDQPMEGGAEITVNRSARHGEFLADKEGRPLYLFTADTGGVSTCYGPCAAAWPPLLAAQGTPTPGAAGVDARLLAVTRRQDGAPQVTYNGHPLYYYASDAGADGPQGQDVHDSGGEWYLVTPQGQKLEAQGGGS